MAITDVDFSPDGARLASASNDETVRLWNVADASEDAQLLGHRDIVEAVAFSPDGASLASASRDSTVRIWSVSDATALRVLQHSTQVYEMDYSPDGDLLATAGYGDIRIWDLATDTVVSILNGQSIPSELLFTPDGRYLVIWLRDVVLFDVASGQVANTLPLPPPSLVTAGGISPYGDVAIGNFNRTITLWNLASLAESAVLSGVMDIAESIVFSPDGATLAAGSRDAAVWLWNVPAAERAYQRGQMPYGVPTEPLPAGLARECDRRFGPGGVVTGQLTDSVTLEPVRSASVRVSEGCELSTDDRGQFSVSGVDTGDSVLVVGFATDYHGRSASVRVGVGDTTRVDFQLARVLPCDPTAHPALPRVETDGDRVVLRLHPELASALEAAAPMFEPLGMDRYFTGVIGGYNLDCHQAPSAVLGDFNGDGSSDLVAQGESQGAFVTLALVSRPSGYEVLTFDRYPTVPQLTDTYFERLEPGTELCSPDLAVLTTHGYLHVVAEKASTYIYYLDGEFEGCDFSTH